MKTTLINDPEVLRKRWFDQPLGVIEHSGLIPDGNGAIIALMAIFPLYERYLNDAFKRSTLGLTFVQFRARDLGLPEDPTTDADQFWNIFRDGLLHSGMPFEDSKSARKYSWILPKISLRKEPGYEALPKYKLTKSGERVICLDPWGFVDFVLSKYRNDPGILTRDADSPLLPLYLVTEEIV